MHDTNPSLSKMTGRYLLPRLLLAGVILTSAALSCISGWFVYSAKLQRQAVAEIRASGGKIYYDLELDQGKKAFERTSSLRTWVMGTMGIDYIGNVSEVLLTDVGTDSDLAVVKRFNRLESLFLARSFITDFGLAIISGSGMDHLHFLYLGDTRLTDVGMISISRLTGLKELYLGNVKLSDVGVSHLSGLTNLRTLYIDHTMVTDSSIPCLQRLPSLQDLNLDYTGVTDACVPSLKKVRSLRSLSIVGTKISDDGVRDLETCLPNTKISYQRLMFRLW